MAQPFLLDPTEGKNGKPVTEEPSDDVEYFDVLTWSPTVAHALECPTARPLERYSGKGEERFVCPDCEWEWRREHGESAVVGKTD